MYGEETEEFATVGASFVAMLEERPAELPFAGGAVDNPTGTADEGRNCSVIRSVLGFPPPPSARALSLSVVASCVVGIVVICLAMY